MSPALGTDIASAVRQSLQQAQLEASAGHHGPHVNNISFEGKNHQLLTRSQVSLLLNSHDVQPGTTTDSNSDLETLHQMMTQSRFESDDCYSRAGTAPSSGCSTPEAKRFSLFDNRQEKEKNPLSASHGSAASLSKPPSLPVKSKSSSSLKQEERRVSTKKHHAATNDSPLDTMSSTSDLNHVVMRSELSSSEMFLTSTTVSVRTNSSTSAGGNWNGWGRRRRQSLRPPESVDAMNFHLTTYDEPLMSAKSSKEKKGIKNAVKKFGRMFSRSKEDKDGGFDHSILSTHGTVYGGGDSTTRQVQSSFHTVYRSVQRPSKRDSTEVEPRSHSTGGLESRASQKRHVRKDSLALNRYSFSGARATLSRSLSQRSARDVEESPEDTGDSSAAGAFSQPFNLYKELGDLSASMMKEKEGAAKAAARDKRPQPQSITEAGSTASQTPASISRQSSTVQHASSEGDLSRLRTPSSGSLADYAPPSTLPKISTYNPLYDACSQKPWQEVVVEPMLPSSPMSATSGISSTFDPPSGPFRRIPSARNLHLGLSPLSSARGPRTPSYLDLSTSGPGSMLSDEAPQPMTFQPSLPRNVFEHAHTDIQDPSTLPFQSQGSRPVPGPRTSVSFIPLSEDTPPDESIIRTADFSRLPSHHWPENVTQQAQQETATGGKPMFSLMNMLSHYQKEMHPGVVSSTPSSPVSRAGFGSGSHSSAGTLSRTHSQSNLHSTSLPASPVHPDRFSASAPGSALSTTPVAQNSNPFSPSRPTPLSIPTTPTHHAPLTNTTPRTPSSHPPRPSLIKASNSSKSLLSANHPTAIDSTDAHRRPAIPPPLTPLTQAHRLSMPSVPHSHPNLLSSGQTPSSLTPLMSSISEPSMLHQGSAFADAPHDSTLPHTGTPRHDSIATHTGTPRHDSIATHTGTPRHSVASTHTGTPRQSGLLQSRDSTVGTPRQSGLLQSRDATVGTPRQAGLLHSGNPPIGSPFFGTHQHADGEPFRAAADAGSAADNESSGEQGLLSATSSVYPSNIRKSSSYSNLGHASSSPSDAPAPLSRSNSSLRQRKATAEVVFSDADGNPITPPMTGATLQASGLLFKPPGSVMPKKASAGEVSNLGRLSRVESSQSESILDGFSMTVGGVRIEAALLLGGALLFVINLVVMLHLMWVIPRTGR